MNDAEFRKTAHDIAQGSRRGCLDGVTFDFTHDDLAPELWQASDFWHVWSDSPLHAKILLPSEAASGSDAELRESKGLTEEFERIEAHPGDHVRILEVREVEIGGVGDDADTLAREADLVIERADAKEGVAFPPGPLRFHSTAKLNNVAVLGAFGNALRRAERLPYEDGRAVHVKTIARLAKRTRDMLVETHPDARNSFAFSLDTLLDKVVSLSYTLARIDMAEAEARIIKHTENNRAKAAAQIDPLRAKWAIELHEQHPEWNASAMGRFMFVNWPDDWDVIDKSAIDNWLRRNAPKLGIKFPAGR